MNKNLLSKLTILALAFILIGCSSTKPFQRYGMPPVIEMKSEKIVTFTNNATLHIDTHTYGRKIGRISGLIRSLPGIEFPTLFIGAKIDRKLNESTLKILEKSGTLQHARDKTSAIAKDLLLKEFSIASNAIISPPTFEDAEKQFQEISKTNEVIVFVPSVHIQSHERARKWNLPEDIILITISLQTTHWSSGEKRELLWNDIFRSHQVLEQDNSKLVENDAAIVKESINNLIFKIMPWILNKNAIHGIAKKSEIINLTGNIISGLIEHEDDKEIVFSLPEGTTEIIPKEIIREIRIIN